MARYEIIVMELKEFLSHFKGVKQTGKNQYIAHCPTREDKDPSLSISVGETGNILLHDHGGDLPENIVAKVGLTMRDLFANNGVPGSGPKGPAPERKVVANYTYFDKDGKPVAVKVRFEPKGFAWCTPKPDGGYDYHKPDRVPVYNAPVLAKAPFVYLVEGEKDVDTLTQNGIQAVSLPDGAMQGKWPSGYTNCFIGKVVIILPDNDDVGIAYARAAWEALRQVCPACAVRDLKKWWPEIPEKGDISDYIAADKAAALNHLKQLQAKAEKWLANGTATVTKIAKPAVPLLKTRKDFLCAIKKLDPYNNKRYTTTDNGSGRLFADLVKGQARYVPGQKMWYIYNSTRWVPDAGNLKVMEMCKTAGDALNIYTLDIGDEKQQEAYQKYTRGWLMRRNRKTILEDAASVYSIDMGEFDANIYLFNCKNGTLDLKTMEFRSHDPEDKLTKIADVVYDSNARCLRFEKFVTEVMSGDVDKSAFLQKALGYALSGDSSHECMFILYGATTRNGKSTLMESTLRVFGDYGITVSPETIAAKQRNSAGPSEDLARLSGRRLANISEPARGLRLNAAQVKSMTGNDSINARFLNCNSFDFRPQFKLYINTNYLPSVDDMSLFSSNRVRVIPFERHFEPQEQDPNLKHLFAEEDAKSAILNWLIAGWQLLQKEGLNSPAAVVEATKEYSHDSNKIALFAEEKLIEDRTGEARTAAVYERYKEWCDVNGCMPENSTNFKKSLQAIGTVVRRRPRDGSEKTTLLLGYRLK